MPLALIILKVWHKKVILRLLVMVVRNFMPIFVVKIVTFVTMKRLSYLLLSGLLALSALLTVPVSAQNYRLSRVRPSRYEVTRLLDLIPDQAAATFLAPYTAGVDSLRMPFVGRSAMFMYAERPESRLSNWVADIMLWAGRQMGEQVDMGLCNIGGLRAALPKDTVRVGDVLAISPFENMLAIVRLKGSDLTHLFENIAFVGGEGVSHGVKMVIDKGGRKLVSATLNGEPIDPERIYTIATLDYLADGNDKLTALKSAVERQDTKTPTRQLIMDYLRWLDKQGKMAEAEVEGRVKTLSSVPLKGEGEMGTAPQRIESSSASQTDSAPSRSQSELPPRQQERGVGGEAASLLIVHTNDTHSCVEPLNPNLSDTAQADKGGYLRRASLVRELRKQRPSLLLFDSGDFSQGSTYYSLYHGDVEVGLMNLMGYDAATIGNHEFDFGLENMSRIFRLAKFPIVCCNYDFTGTPCEGLVKPYVILQRGDMKIGVLGVSPKLEGLVAAHTCEGVTFTDPIKAAQPIVNHLRNEERCDLVVCLSHLGWKADGVSDEEFIVETQGIDIVLGGHTHTYFERPEVLTNRQGQVVVDNQMGKNGRFVGLLDLTLMPLER